MTALPWRWTMTDMTVMPRESHDWTVHDLDLIPEDGLQYELLDGALLVSPAPVPRHQRAAARLYLLLAAACPPDLEAFFAPLDWRPDIRTSLQPDLLVVRKEDVELANITRPLVLAVEILSPSTRRKYAVYKRSKYEDSDVAGYWIVGPEPNGEPRRPPARDGEVAPNRPAVTGAERLPPPAPPPKVRDP